MSSHSAKQTVYSIMCIKVTTSGENITVWKWILQGFLFGPRPNQTLSPTNSPSEPSPAPLMMFAVFFFYTCFIVETLTTFGCVGGQTPVKQTFGICKIHSKMLKAALTAAKYHPRCETCTDFIQTELFFSFPNKSLWSQGKESGREGSQSKETESPQADKKAQSAKTHQKTKSTKTHEETEGTQSHQEAQGDDHGAARQHESVPGGQRGGAGDWKYLGHMYVKCTALY